MTAQFRIDQVGLPAGVNGQSRDDGLATGAVVTLTSTGGGTTHDFTLLWVPDNDTTAEASLAGAGTVWTFTPTVLAYGTYRIELVVDAGLATESRDVKTFAIRTVNLALRIPGLNELADSRANLTNDGAPVIASSETNRPIGGGPFASGNYGGWYHALRELIVAVDALSVSADGRKWASLVDVVGNTVAVSNQLVVYTPGAFSIKMPPGPATRDCAGVKNKTTSAVATTIEGNGENIEDPVTGLFVASFSLAIPNIGLEYHFLSGVGWLLTGAT